MLEWGKSQHLLGLSRNWDGKSPILTFGYIVMTIVIIWDNKNLKVKTFILSFSQCYLYLTIIILYTIRNYE